jgi:hypothetical protein
MRMFLALATLLTLLLLSLPAQAMFTYQGQLVHNGEPYTGEAEIRMSLWDSLQGGNQLHENTDTVQVSNGLFQTSIGTFPLAHLDSSLWIEVEVLQPTPATTLEPRQTVTPAPKSWRASRAADGIFDEGAPFRILGPGGNVFTAGRVSNQVRVGIGSAQPNAHLSVGSNLDFWSMGGSITVDRPTIRGTSAGSLALSAGGTGALHLNSDGGSSGIRFYDGSGDSAGEVMRITASGRVGIGTPSPWKKLHVDGDATVTSRLGVGTVDPQVRLHVNGTANVSDLIVTPQIQTNQIFLTTYSTLGGSTVCRVSGTGLLNLCSSTRRLKNNITTLEQASELLAALRPVHFTWKDDDKADLGLIAEEVAEVIPELVTSDNEGRIGGINYRHLTAVIIGAWQEQQAEIATLRAELEAERQATADRLAALEALLLDNTGLVSAD